jgi:hypothetical protein
MRIVTYSGFSVHDGTLLHSKSQYTTVKHSQQLLEHTYTSDPHGPGTLTPIEFFQQDLLWLSSNTHSHSCSQKASKHTRSIRRRAIGSLAHHSGTSAHSPSLTCHLPAPSIEYLHRPRYKLTCFSRFFPVRTQCSNQKESVAKYMSALKRFSNHPVVSVEVHRHPTRIHRNARPLLRAQQCCLFTLLSTNHAEVVQHCCVTKETQQCCASALL